MSKSEFLHTHTHTHTQHSEKPQTHMPLIHIDNKTSEIAPIASLNSAINNINMVKTFITLY